MQINNITDVLLIPESLYHKKLNPTV